jgi:lipopolysaccharide export system permease protein
MKTLHLYLTRQVLATLFMTVAVFTFVLLLGNALKEILVLLINRQATLGGVAEAIGLLIPFVWVFALPMGMLTAALLVFGRFSADQELTAVRSSGISLVALITPILILSLALCGVSAWINMEIAPQCRVAYKSLLFRMGLKLSSSVLPEGRLLKDFPGRMIYIGKNDGQTMKDIRIYELDTNQSVSMVILSPRGSLEITNHQPILHLFDVQMIEWNGQNPTAIATYDEPLKSNLSEPKEEKPSLSDMTFRQLQEALRDLDQSFARPTPRTISSKELHRWKEELEQQKQNMTMPILVQIHRQVAFSFACFGFTLVGIPLGIRAHRRETNIGIAMALILAMAYYSIIILGQSLQTHAELAPYLIVWIPNFIFQSAGAVMLWRANKGI